ncbi:sodium/glutamate symporter [Pseudoxanthomonas jiangsuensis]|uniref:sodium/glutamate symporter n=1 Tax=Pseudoxanthomonas jiangsuensis TaxID=619688 RepID=UPI001390D248|nr:sodium/glutamate symporter [Pseudoxanthomonas jiangsuensis]KAF1697279.1 sodium/glutamate symporter [Pseudoxanthomonas jiangsuensis]
MTAVGAVRELPLDAFVSFTLAILLLFVGKGLAARIGPLRRYGIPEAVVGGVLCAVVICLLYYVADVYVQLHLDARDMLLLYFFAALGLNSNVRMLFSGGRALVVLLALAAGFIVMQNGVGMLLATVFGMDPRAGLMVGSISLTGGVGTTLAWAPHFSDVLGITAAAELGMAANMVGLVAACVIGGPIAGWLIRRHPVMPSADAELEVGTLYGDDSRAQLDYYGVLLALFWLNVVLLLGQGVSTLIAMSGLNLPAFVGCLLAGIVLRSVGDLVMPRGGRLWRYDEMKPGLALLSDICLGLFLTMALMGLKLWELQPILGFITVTMAVQIALVVAFTVLVVFRAMGRDYEAAVMCSAFGGITLGSTATAVANMSAVTREYGAAPRAFIVVPLVCGFFIDLVNAVIVGMLAN